MDWEVHTVCGTFMLSRPATIPDRFLGFAYFPATGCDFSLLLLERQGLFEQTWEVMT